MEEYVVVDDWLLQPLKGKSGPLKDSPDKQQRKDTIHASGQVSKSS